MEQFLSEQYLQSPLKVIYMADVSSIVAWTSIHGGRVITCFFGAVGSLAGIYFDLSATPIASADMQSDQVVDRSVYIFA